MNYRLRSLLVLPLLVVAGLWAYDFFIVRHKILQLPVSNTRFEDVAFLISGRSYRMRSVDGGSLYSLYGLIDPLNVALADTTHPKRFFVTSCNDGNFHELLWFITPQLSRQLSEEFGIEFHEMSRREAIDGDGAASTPDG